MVERGIEMVRPKRRLITQIFICCFVATNRVVENRNKNKEPVDWGRHFLLD